MSFKPIVLTVGFGCMFLPI